jgi:hypothetical protein
MAQRRTKQQRAEDTFAQHRKQFRSRAASEAMGRFYRTNYTRRLANEALPAGDTAAYAFFDEQTLIGSKWLRVYGAEGRALARGDHAAANSKSLELEALRAQFAPLPTPDTLPPQRR